MKQTIFIPLNEDSSCVRLLIKGNLERNHSWESDGRDSN